ncbi:MAG TPA: cupin domain-containing protein [Acidimicrobiales bacterium]|nr:cupin domain-containing protein [Acidimicrobiales bacterium]
MSQPFDLSSTYVHLGRGATAEPLGDFRWDDEYLERYTAAHAADGDDGRLVMIGDVSSTWTSWERHPAGEEVVVVLSGRVTLVQEVDGEERRAEMSPGQAIVNPVGVWHTCDVHEPGQALYITPGAGTEHRPRT